SSIAALFHFCFTYPPTTHTYTLSLHDALPISAPVKSKIVCLLIVSSRWPQQTVSQALRAPGSPRLNFSALAGHRLPCPAAHCGCRAGASARGNKFVAGDLAFHPVGVDPVMLRSNKPTR